MTSGSGVWLSVCLGAWWCVWLGPEKSIAPRVTIAWANRSAGQRTFGLADVDASIVGISVEIDRNADDALVQVASPSA
ncbi:hypothetical protein CFAM422_004364 [Trichoderma lentiforme]|uniref:Uncharacterized protein n=1 Tax=Trichoderma lentiforme TaxID=1567552 RepID=A0A9P4XI03_9HYPO|nr:hypothetical protein CFAM422_004364 [Trichoderma lentiforme]